MENINKKGAETAAVEAPKKKQKVSKSYLVRSYGENIRKLEETGLVSKEQLIKLREIQGEIIRKLVEGGI